MPKISPITLVALLFTGHELRKMHSWEAPPDIEPWYGRKLAKHDRYLAQYKAGEVRINDDAKIIAFIEDHLPMMKDRPNLFQHDDYHLRNLVIKDRSLAGAIDFGRHDWGDPIHEFLKVGQFCSSVSIDFSVGQIRGYYDGQKITDEFWELYSLYIAMSSFSFVIWTQHVCPERMSETMNIIERVLLDHDWFERNRPKWYSDYQ